MNFDKVITINGNKFNFVDLQRSLDSAIYKNESAYLRIGDPSKIKKDIDFHKRMAAQGFPVAKFIDEGPYEDKYFFIEESLGQNFGELFTKETEQFGKIKNETFSSFVKVCEEFALAQTKSAPCQVSWAEFEKGLHVEYILSELPLESDRIISALNIVEKRLSVFPFVITHGDFTPFNVCQNGTIDLEDSFIGPAGFDPATIAVHLDWFPESKEYEYFQKYSFSESQNFEFIGAIDDVYVSCGFPKLSGYIPEFNLIRGIWFSVRMHNTPKIQAFRYNLLKNLLNKYL
ncbi:MAG: hypothetical protein ACD_76C00142G0005 [uncultured bacterium]|nr:MAG: hypothetical protein ACD_76C00142G0005 [uncultured bacterium]HBD04957.1 hypothetical protein [Candidatus Uhrbacteria bacterium]